MFAEVHRLTIWNFNRVDIFWENNGNDKTKFF